jgi:phosphoserine phosphatase
MERNREHHSTMMVRIILTRHGHVDGIKPARFRGRTDVPLTALGVAQANATARWIAAISRPTTIYTSPMSRCVATGAAIARACGAPSQVLDQLNDLDYGAWQWKTHDEIRTAFAEQYQTWHTAPQMFRFPRGESLPDLVTRAGDALRHVLQWHQDQTVVLVSHDSFNRALLTQVLDQPLSAYSRIVVEPCGITEIEFVGHIARVLRVNETQHLNALDEPGTERTERV